MLLVFRRMADSIVAKLLLGLIVLSFGVWGVGDMFQGGRDVTLAKVGREKITLGELQPDIERELAQARRMSGGAVPDVLADMIQQDVLSRVVRRRLLLQEADAMGIRISDETLVTNIRGNPVFHDAAGQFSKDQFIGQLRHIGLSESAFLESERQDLTIQYLVRGIAPGGGLPQRTLLAMLQKQAEIKQVEVVDVPASAVGAVPAPTDADLLAFFQKHQAAYSSPETRELDYIVLDRAGFLDQVSVSEEAIDAEYESRRDEFVSDETVELQQLIARTREDAAKAYQELRDKADFLKVARKYGVQDAETTTLTLRPQDLLDDSARNAVNKLQPGEFTGPVESPLGWHVYRLVKRHKGEAVSEAEARRKIAAELKEHRADEQLFEAIAKMEDAAAGGTPLADLAKEYGGTVKSLGPVTAEGLSPDGSRAAVPGLKDFLKTAFATREGQVSPFVENGDGTVYAVQVRVVNRERERALDEVRGAVIAAWQKDRRATLLKDKAAEAAAKAANGEVSAGAALKEAGLSGSVRVVSIDPARPETFASLPPAVLEALQTIEVGRQTPVGTGKDGNVVWAKLVSITPSTLTADAADFKKMEAVFAQLAATEQLEQYLSYLEKAHGVSVYPERLPRRAGQDD